MRTYELTYILPDKFSEKEIPQISEKIKKFLPNGKIIKENLWGRRKLAYPIKKNDWGFYVTLVFETDPENIEKVESKLKLEEDLIRHLIVSVKLPPPIKKVGKEIKKEVKPKKVEIPKPKVRVRAKPKKAEKPKKAKITAEIEKEEEKMKVLEEKLEEILKE